ncbi:PIN domain-containing protein [Streptomyces solicathayae]|uniref:PIN domain-containing protein n=1 Tax=Streptomyces solicathayae TaxID=3081768 RepID=A0ABZ0LTB3_9ACTN|nr:PIN domain-containing protein [Streptomyces sp. HUAS YS2]WOX22713.1 PIN domain-containing protein [Streptomyces sp. HUAS YS2]
MIIFDTNAVNELDPHGSKADLIRLLRKAGLEVAAPWVVIEELTAHKLYEYQRHFDLMLRQHQELARLEPNLAGLPPTFRGERFADHWRNQYSDIFAVLPTSQSALRTAVLRESACIKPAKVDKSKKSGGRDVAVWFSILEHLGENPEAKVYFVSNNTTDFGEPDKWPFPLNLDLGESVHRITHLLNFEDALKEFTEEAEAPEGIQEALTARLSSRESTATMAREAWRRVGRSHFRMKGGDAPPKVRVSFDSIEPVECRRIGSSVWYWSKVKWQLYVLQRRHLDPLMMEWDTSILFPEGDTAPISLLRGGRIAPITLDELDGELKDSLSRDLLSFEEEMTQEEYQSTIDDEDASDDPRRLAISRRLQREQFDSRNLDARYALVYSHRVFDALRRVNDSVYITDGPGDLGADAISKSREGLIAVSVKAGEGRLRMADIEAAIFNPSSLTDAALLVTSRHISKNLELEIEEVRQHAPCPFEVAHWVSERDDATLRTKIESLRRRMAAQ